LSPTELSINIYHVCKLAEIIWEIKYVCFVMKLFSIDSHQDALKYSCTNATTIIATFRGMIEFQTHFMPPGDLLVLISLLPSCLVVKYIQTD